MADEADANLSPRSGARNGTADRHRFDPELSDRITKAIHDDHHGIREGGVCAEGGSAVDLADELGVDRDTQHFRDQQHAKLAGAKAAAGAASWFEAPSPSTPRTVEEFAQARGIALETLEQFEVTLETNGPRPALRYPTTLGIDRLKYLDGKRPKYR